ncbi:hypothetical protein HMPREF3130_08280 [Corynebacterium sp. HMSC14B06]|nr:hypothetical protein HMPREF3130_08280 [Corynebacterium sp. HMSC14B06]
MLGAESLFMPLMTVRDNTVEAVEFVAHSMAVSGVATVLLDPEGRAVVDGRTKPMQKKRPSPVLEPGNGRAAQTAREAVVRWSEANGGAVPQIAAVVRDTDPFIFLTGAGLEQWWQVTGGGVCPPRTFGRFLVVEGITAGVARGTQQLQVAGVGSIVPLPPSGDVYMTADTLTAPPALEAALMRLPQL